MRLPSPPRPRLRRNLALETILKARAQSCPFDLVGTLYRETLETWGDVGRAALGRVDRFFLLTVLLHRPDAVHPWLYARCREVEAAPDGRLDLWAREHYKSTIITFAGSIQEILNDPEITIGIFSHTKPVAKKFMAQIKAELETNADLHRLYPDVLYANPRRESPRWSEDKGICCKRLTNPKEATVEAHGVVDGQPTGAHYRLRIYDDLVTVESVTTPDMVEKTTNAYALSGNLGARGPDGGMRAWHLGTRYKFSDTYQWLLDRKSLIPRIYAATVDGTPTGKPVFLTQAALDEKRRDQPSPIFAAQMLMNPAAGTEQMFREEWPRFTDIRPSTLNVYILCDPASSKKRGSDRTAMLVIGIDAARNKYLLDGYIHKMGLTERWKKLSDLWKKWTQEPGVQLVKVGYERFGMRDALEHFEERMEVERIGFEIVELAWPEDSTRAKYDRIQRLEPDFRGGKWFFADQQPVDTEGRTVETKAQAAVRAAGQAYRVFTPTRRRDHENNVYSLNKLLFDEYVPYPYSAKDDGLDCLSRIYDIDPAPPVLIDHGSLEPEVFADGA